MTKEKHRQSYEDLPLFSSEMIQGKPSNKDNTRQPIDSTCETIYDVIVNWQRLSSLDTPFYWHKNSSRNKENHESHSLRHRKKKEIFSVPAVLPCLYKSDWESPSEVKLSGMRHENWYIAFLIEIDHSFLPTPYQQPCNKWWNNWDRHWERIFVTRYTKGKKKTKKYSLLTQDYWKWEWKGITEVRNGWNNGWNRVELNPESLELIKQHCISFLRL